jgi:hypothetical protein
MPSLTENKNLKKSHSYLFNFNLCVSIISHCFTADLFLITGFKWDSNINTASIYLSPVLNATLAFHFFITDMSVVMHHVSQNSRHRHHLCYRPRMTHTDSFFRFAHVGIREYIMADLWLWPLCVYLMANGVVKVMYRMGHLEIAVLLLKLVFWKCNAI